MSEKNTVTTVTTSPDEPDIERARGESQLRRVLRGRWGTFGGIILFGVVFILVWEGIFRLKILSKFIIPSAFLTLKEIIRIFGDVFTGGEYLTSTWITIEEIAVGFALGMITGIVLGIIIGETAFGRRILMPYVVGFNAMPKVAFAPLFVAALGFGLAPKILMAAVISFFPIVVNTATGIESATDNELILFRAMEASRWKTLWKLKLPTALPYVFAGLKIAAVLAVIGAVVADILSGGTGGLGKQIMVASIDLRTSTIFALIVLLSIVGLVVFMIVAIAEHYIVHWRQPKWPEGRCCGFLRARFSSAA
jgi:NitT/TauT family transport system permease protein